ncbi:DUF4145 domain-containing protein [Zunongwangia endophytica]|uniref:DUF4145 domain-containing protein n=1 Tax=Zunongwangia endophytica TaxID=1808945 RepID=A0ABV8HE87_9FLAO|nr:DUF4145 domain-containing protein [Zunongwangia endophytica]MDN3594655.1 DUF4145 domain-containing protein [Zunongwangia endophytica]
MSSKFSFLKKVYPSLYEKAIKAENLSYIDSGSSIVICRQFVEEMIVLLIKLEKIPDENFENQDLFKKINSLKSKNIIPKGAFKSFNIIRKAGNKAAHGAENIGESNFSVLSECYRLSIWLIFTYDKIFIENQKYKNKTDPSLNLEDIEVLCSNLEMDHNELEVKIENLNKDYKKIKNRRKRSRLIDQVLDIGLAAIGIGGGLLILAAIGTGPVGIATGLITGAGRLAYKFNKKHGKSE